MKLYVKDLESGEMLEVTGLILRSQSTSLGIPIEITMDDIDADPDAALCDEHGMLLKPEDPHQALKDELLRVKDDYIRLLSYEAGRIATIGVTHPQFAPAPETIDEGIAIRRNIADLEAKLKTLKRNTMSKEYVVSFITSEQITECEWKIRTPSMKITSETTIAEIETFYRKWVKVGEMEVKIVELSITVNN